MIYCNEYKILSKCEQSTHLIQTASCFRAFAVFIQIFQVYCRILAVRRAQKRSTSPENVNDWLIYEPLWKAFKYISLFVLLCCVIYPCDARINGGGVIFIPLKLHCLTHFRRECKLPYVAYSALWLILKWLFSKSTVCFFFVFKMYSDRVGQK